METTKTQETFSNDFDDSDVSNWRLPEGAMHRLGRGDVMDMEFSPDGQYFAVGSNIGLWIYETTTFSPIALWETDRGHIDGIAFSSNSQWIAAYTYLQALRVWDIQNGSVMAEIELTEDRVRFGISKPVFSQDDEHIAAFNDYNKKVYIWCPHTGKEIKETDIRLNGIKTNTIGINPKCFTTDLSLLAGTNYDYEEFSTEFIAVWCLKTGKQIARFEWSETWSNLCFSPCGRFLAVGGSEGNIHVLDVVNNRLEATHTGYGDFRMTPYYAKGSGLMAFMVNPSEPKIEIWNLEKNEKLDMFKKENNKGKKKGIVRFSESGSQVAYTNDGVINFWTKDIHKPQPLSSIQGHNHTVGTLVFISEENTLLTTYWDWKAIFLDVSSQCGRRPNGEDLPISKIRNVYLSSDGKVLATGGNEAYLKVWEMGVREPSVEIPIPEQGISQVTGGEAFSLQGDKLAFIGRDHNIYVWECKSSEGWKMGVSLIGHTEYIEGIAFSPDGTQLSSISRDRTARLWDVEVGKQIIELPLNLPSGQRQSRSYARGIAFSPKGDLIAGGQWGEIVLWNATDGQIYMTIPQPEGNQRPITLCFSPCGEYLLSGSWWQEGLQKVPIRLWKVATGENIATFSGHTTDVQCFAFNQDCSVLASGGHDGVIFLWDLRPFINS